MRKLRWTKTVPRKPGYYWVRVLPGKESCPAHNAGLEWTFIGTDQACSSHDLRGAEFMRMEPPSSPAENHRERVPKEWESHT